MNLHLNPDLLIAFIVLVSAVLLFVAGMAPKLKRFRFRSPIVKVEPRKRSKSNKRNKRRR